jgi:hypothetical protein
MVKILGANVHNSASQTTRNLHQYTPGKTILTLSYSFCKIYGLLRFKKSIKRSHLNF